jgi:hypothetical protein
MSATEKVQFTSKPATTEGRGDGSRCNAASLALKRRSFVAILAGVRVFGLAVFAPSSFAQTSPTADVRASINSPLSATPPMLTEEKSIQPFRISVLEAQLIDLRKRIGPRRFQQ